MSWDVLMCIFHFWKMIGWLKGSIVFLKNDAHFRFLVYFSFLLFIFYIFCFFVWHNDGIMIPSSLVLTLANLFMFFFLHRFARLLLSLGKLKWQYITLTNRIFWIDYPGVVYQNSDSETDIVLKGVVSCHFYFTYFETDSSCACSNLPGSL